MTSIDIALVGGERGINGQPVFLDQIGNDGFAVADRDTVVDHIGQLSARRRRCIENMLMGEGQAGEPHEGKNFEPIAVVIGDAEQLGI